MERCPQISSYSWSTNSKMKFMVVCLFLCVGALAEPAYKKYGITTPEEISRDLNARIIQGNPAGANQIPYQIYQIMTHDDGSRYSCGASIISNRWAVTAAHCLLGAAFTDAYMGNVRIDSAPVVWRSYNLHVHPGYNSDNLNNDIALFGFDNDLPFGDNIWSINLARNPGDSFEGQTATASGYGVIYENGPGSDTLMYVALRVISNGECSNTYGGIIIDSTICTVGTASEAQGTCFGDSGGPLALGSGRDATLIGVVSFVSGNGCESPNPAGFVRPTHFLDWIGSITGI